MTNISSDVIRGYHDTMILRILLERDSYGYEISKEIEARSLSNYSIKETTLYSAVTRMESRGLIASYYGKESYGKRRTYYTVTPKGLSYYREKCTEWRLTRKVINQFMKEEEDDGSNQGICGGDVPLLTEDRRGGEIENTDYRYDGAEIRIPDPRGKERE